STAGNGDIRTDVSDCEQVENRTGVIGFEVGDGHPHVGPHAVVPAARWQPVRDAELSQVLQRADLRAHRGSLSRSCVVALQLSRRAAARGITYGSMYVGLWRPGVL